jgi:hypothetical protein
MNFQDWFIMAVATLVWVASTVFLFIHPETSNFVSWCGLACTMSGLYHWLSIHDSKIKDAE